MVARSLGANHHLVTKLDGISYGLGIWTSSTPKSAWATAFAGGVAEAVGYIDAAIYELEMLTGDDRVLEALSFDRALWAHVKDLVEAEDWGKVASQVPIFVEDQIRRWSAAEHDVIGKSLYTGALADDGVLRLGSTKAEWEAWRSLGVGFTGAVRNATAHRIEQRPDARRYAIGILGLGSLLLSQIRHEHGDAIDER